MNEELAAAFVPGRNGISKSAVRDASCRSEAGVPLVQKSVEMKFSRDLPEWNNLYKSSTLQHLTAR